MKKISRYFLAPLMIVSLTVATVICCCIAPSVVPQLHKTVKCSHCHGQNPQRGSSNPAEACQQQLSGGEFLRTFTLDSSHVIKSTVTVPVFLDRYSTHPLLSSLSSYPRGSPSSVVMASPLYLRTFYLRI